MPPARSAGRPAVAGRPTVVAGVDCGTQSTKVVLRDADSGDVRGLASRPHRAEVVAGRSEQDPADWLQAMRACLDELAERTGLAPAALSVAGQQHGLVVTDAAGRPLRPAKLWNDTESAPDARRLVEALGAGAWAERTGSVPTASFTVTKLAWLARCEPDHDVRRVALPHDWLTHALTGRWCTDRGDASGTGVWSSADGWQADLLALAGPYRPSQLPEVLGPDEVAGRTSEGAVVAAGTGDNMAAALGLGARPGDVVLSLGTSGVASSVSGTPSRDPTGAVAGFADATGRYLPLVCTLNGTQVTDWAARLAGAPLDVLLAQSPPGARGATLLPYLSGERTPDRPRATGALHGITLATAPADLARAAAEGVVAALLDAADHLPPADGRLLLTGGGARSEGLRRLVADLAAREVTVLDAPEAVALGAAVQAAAVLRGEPVQSVAEAWAPEPREVVTAGTDAAGVRARHAALRAALA